MANPIAPIIIRGEVIDTDLIEYPGRGDVMTFDAPDPKKFVDRLPLSSPAKLTDLYDLSLEDILDYLEELGSCLDINKNEHMQRSRFRRAKGPQQDDQCGRHVASLAARGGVGFHGLHGPEPGTGAY